VSTDLLAATAELVSIPSVSLNEARLADHVEAVLRGCEWLAVERVGDNVVARSELGRPARLVVAGHLDTVPPAGNQTPRIEGDVLYGLGAADMKGGLAVMLELAVAAAPPELDVTWCFYRGEEIDRAENGLVQLVGQRPELVAGDAAVLCEPTGGLVEAGCQGTIRARVELGGIRAHTARPHRGINAIHRLGAVIARVASYEPRSVVLDGCEYVERLQVVAVEGGVAANVVPDRASATVNFRFAPDRDSERAQGFLAQFFEDVLEADRGDRYEVLDVGPAAPPRLDHPLLARLLEATGRPPRAKLGWTDVATFAAQGVPATNYGPGDPELAHQAHECVTRASLEEARAHLGALLGV
jgi:succinyl-diaminopimelate desuccinylase